MGIYTVLLLGFLAAPGTGDAGQAFPVMVSAEEVAAVQARLMARVQANRERVCERPVVGGPAIPGSGSALLAAAIEGGGDEVPCARFAEVLKEEVSREAVDRWRQDPSTIPSNVRDGYAACAGMNAQVADAVRRYDVCSPYQPGVRPVPRLIGFMRRGKLAVMALRADYDPADPRATLVPLMSWIRLTQDIYRGGGTLLPAMIGVALLEADLIPNLRWILDEGDLDAATLRAVAGDLGDLVDTEPSVGPVIANDSDFMALQTVMPVLNGPDWVPPGGWEEGYGPVSERGSGGLLGEISIIGVGAEAALLAVAFDEINRQQREACPAESPIATCRARLIEIAEARAAKATDVSMWRLGMRILLSGDPVHEIRTIVVDILAAISLPAFHKYIDRLAARAYLLGALRIHALVLLDGREKGICPAVDVLRGEPWDRILEDPVFGGKMALSLDEGGTYHVAPAGAFDGAAEDEAWAYEFTCAAGD